ncbi:MAG: ATP-binding protein [Verrucomicrobiota bacterium]
MEEFQFIGRTRILEDLQEELGKPGNAVDSHRMLFIYGDPGVGKTAVLDELWRTLDSSAQPHLWLRISKVWDVDSGARAREAFTKGILANRDEHKKTVSTFAREAGRVALSEIESDGFDDQDHSSFEEEFSSSLVPDEDFSVRAARASERTRIWVQLLEDYFVFNNLAGSNGSFLQNPRITIVIDDIDKATPTLVRWITKEFMPLLFYESQRKDLRLIVTSSDEAKLKTIKFPVGERPVESRIEPFTLGEIQGMLERRGLSIDKDLAVYNKTRGFPSDVAKEIQAMVSQRHESELSTVVAKIFRGKEPEQQRWMIHAAYCPFISPESMMLFYKESDAPRVAAAVLKNAQFIDEKMSRGGYHMADYYAEFLREYNERHNPEDHQALLKKAEKFESICSRIPREDSRNWLSRLSVSSFINEDLAKQLFPQDFRKIKQILERDRDYFIKTKFNLKLSPTAADDISTYRGLLSIDDGAEIRERLASIWSRTEEKVQDEITNLQNSIEQEKKKLERTLQDAGKLKRQIEAIREKADKWRKRKKPRTEIPDDVQQGSRLASAVFCEIIGIVIMYFSVLSQSTYTMPLSAVALALMIYGLFMPYSGHTKALAAAVANATPNPFETAESMQKQRMLILRISDLENQKSLLTSRIGKLRKSLHEKDELLQEPFV